MWNLLWLIWHWRREGRRQARSGQRHSDAVGDYVVTDVGVWTQDGFVEEKQYLPPVYYPGVPPQINK